MILVTLVPRWKSSNFEETFQNPFESPRQHYEGHFVYNLKKIKEIVGESEWYQNVDDSHLIVVVTNFKIFKSFKIVLKALCSNKKAICEQFEKNKGFFLES